MTDMESFKSTTITRRWWKEAVVYQVYPRSFQDSNGDGIGDIPGITARLDYILGLGVNVIWLSPHFDSPNADNGYDIRDYREVMREFGTMADFDSLLAETKKRGMRLIIDLVVNHTSDEHVWFAESRASKDNPYRDYYIWHPGRDGREPNDWRSFFSGSAWTYDPPTGEYYMHLFAAKQPDINWDNPAVRADVYDIMRFWLDKGVDGFRMDVIPFISKQDGLPDYPDHHRVAPQFFHGSGPRLHDYLQEMNREVLSHYDVMTVGEAFGVTTDATPLLVDERRGELNMIFNFDAVRIGRGETWHTKPWALPELKAIYAGLDAATDRHCWGTVFLSNHDNPRLVSRFGDDHPDWRVPSAKVLATLILTLKGTPFIYQGDELGMTNYPFGSVEEYDDIEVRNAWQAEVMTGKADAAEFLAEMLKISRDHSRTPMQWDASSDGGFTRGGKPWLSVNPNYRAINADAALADPDSIYHYYAALIRFRRETPALIYGDYDDLAPDHPHLFVYTRTLGSERYVVALNFSRDAQELVLPTDVSATSLVIGRAPQVDRMQHDAARIELAGWEARIYHCA
ncbi:alpha-glucosidase [Agrobacterium sp. SORGH_AS 787]|uniref:glycoside hydrolase family 13 protein n=1 Tax=Agrobacterium sp. SORGH_AS 787 TaxID=3041775 RepID=UPI00277E8FFE|nr:oligo-1,6-glucosidase [Rhizobium sp. SORGH_AS_0787]